ncbi:alpha/beta hydrolase [Paenibacillus yanchengensis]|uniref:Alpha/beta hydrolase n=1 Tax=Paenibacillus yanchengensis TaxID=2035833 RepID=A0ABW4YF89_9BACL
MEKSLIIRHDELQLTATLHYPKVTTQEDNSKYPAIIVCHGFIGSRIGVDRLFVKAARALAATGAYVIRFDYGGCGESSGDYGALGFEEMIHQTRTVIDYMHDIENVDWDKITLLGHSLGAAVAIMTGVRDRRVNRLVLWSPVGYPFNDIVNIVGRHSYDEAVKSGQTDYMGYRLQPAFFESLMQHQPFQAAVKFTGDVLLVHGTSDEDIPVDYSFLYQKVFWSRSQGICDKQIIFQANHTYSSQAYQSEAIEYTKAWLVQLDAKEQLWFDWSI